MPVTGTGEPSNIAATIPADACAGMSTGTATLAAPNLLVVNRAMDPASPTGCAGR